MYNLSCTLNQLSHTHKCVHTFVYNNRLVTCTEGERNVFSATHWVTDWLDEWMNLAKPLSRRTITTNCTLRCVNCLPSAGAARCNSSGSLDWLPGMSSHEKKRRVSRQQQQRVQSTRRYEKRRRRRVRNNSHSGGSIWKKRGRGNSVIHGMTRVTMVQKYASALFSSYLVGVHLHSIRDGQV